MSIPETSPATPDLAAPAAPTPVDRWRWLLSGVLGILGGYVTVGALTGQLTGALGGVLRFGAAETALLLLELVFGIVVTAVAFALAPGSVVRRVIAICIFALAAVALALLITARHYWGLSIPLPLHWTVNPYWLILFVGALGWLLASGARPIAFLSLALTLLIAPLGFALQWWDLGAALGPLVQLGVALLIAAAVLWVSRPTPGILTSSPIAANPSAQDTKAPSFDRWRWLLAGMIGIVGGYLTLSAVTTPLLFSVTRGLDPAYLMPLIAEAVFALAVTSFAFVVAPGARARRVLAIAIFCVIAIVLVALLIGRLSGNLSVPGPTLFVFLNPYWIVLFAGGLGWLIAAGSRAVAYFTLLLAIIVMPIEYLFALNAVEHRASALVAMVLSLVIAVVILIVSRPAAPDPTQ